MGGVETGKTSLISGTQVTEGVAAQESGVPESADCADSADEPELFSAPPDSSGSEPDDAAQPVSGPLTANPHLPH